MASLENAMNKNLSWKLLLITVTPLEEWGGRLMKLHNGDPVGLKETKLIRSRIGERARVWIN